MVKTGSNTFLEDQSGDKSTSCPHKYRKVSEIHYFIIRLAYLDKGGFKLGDLKI